MAQMMKTNMNDFGLTRVFLQVRQNNRPNIIRQEKTIATIYLSTNGRRRSSVRLGDGLVKGQY
jgi:hypothetical protein